MKNSFLKFFVALLATLTITGCNETSPLEPPQPPTAPEVIISAPDISIPDVLGGSTTAQFTTNVDWSIETSDTKASPDWFDVSPKNGEAGEVTLTITTTKANEEHSARTAYINIKAGTVTKTITLTLSAIANDVIYYTAKDAKVIAPNKTDGFGATIVSNTYEDGFGKITFDANVTSIGDEAFSNCVRLKSITIPRGVTSIGNYAFAGCSNLASFTGKFASQDGSCLIIEGMLHSFARAGVTAYTIESGVTSIGNGAFAYCLELASITIPGSVIYIGESAFSNCVSLASVYCKSTTPPTLDSPDSSYKNAPNRTIYVPAASGDAYKIAPNWSDYASAIETEL